MKTPIIDQPQTIIQQQAGGSACVNEQESEAMAANTPSDRWSLLLQQRKLYEVDVAEALLSEEREERDERLRLVRVCQPMAVKSLQAVSVFDPEDYEE